MRKTIIAFALLAFAAPLFASSPFAGTWKLNAAKTKYTTGKAPKEVTMMIEEQEANLKVTATGTNNDGTPISVKYSVPTAGGDATVEEGQGFDAITAKQVSDHVRKNSYTKGGAVVLTRHMTVSADGKTIKSKVEGTNFKGEKVMGVDIYEKE